MEPKLIKLYGRLHVPVYPPPAMTCHCPEHGATHLQDTAIRAVVMGCGCRWQLGSGDRLDGWFRAEDQARLKKGA